MIDGRCLLCNREVVMVKGNYLANITFDSVLDKPGQFKQNKVC